VEFKRVVGTRRSIRFFKPWKPVEREKIQVILEAANRCSRSVNADYPKAVVVNRDDLSPETIDGLRTPTTTADLDLAPTYIFWYTDLQYGDRAQDSLKELVNLGVLTPSHGWSEAYVDDVVYAQVLKPLLGSEAREWMGAIETGLAIDHAMLAAVDEGLGVCLHAFGHEAAKEALDIPDTWMPAWLMLLGYPAEDPEAGGQRPRRPLSQHFFEGKYGEENRWREDPEVTGRLKREGMIQRPAPLPWRQEEVRYLSRMFGMPE
jgi:nitroreductase